MFKFKRLRYRHKIAFIIFVFALLPMLVLGSFLTSRIYSSKVKDILAEKNTQLETSVSGIDAMLMSHINKVFFINNNYYVINYLETDSDQNLIGIMNFSDYLQSIMKAAKTDNVRSDIVIYSLKDTNYDGEFLRSISNLEQEKGTGDLNLKEEILNGNNDEVIWKIKKAKLNAISEIKLDYIYAYKKVVSLNKVLAIIEMRIPLDQLLDYFPYDIPKGSYIEYKGGIGEYDGFALKSNTDEVRGSSDYVLSRKLMLPIGSIEWHIPKGLVFKELRWYWVSVGIIFLVIVAILLFTVEVVSFYLTKRLETLLRKMNKNVESLINDDDETMLTYSTHDEFEKMGNSFYELIQRIKEYYKRISDFELERKVLETQLLQERFNPHFLYNTLSTMRWITEDKRVKDVVDSMVKYYRIALNKGSSIVTITQELEMIEEYLRLQKFAYGNEFEYVIDRDEGIGDHPVLKHLLQPIVENAVLHGLNGRDTGGVIHIAVKRRTGHIAFEISDNGTGMAPEKIKQVLNGNANGQYGGYGMINIRKRLETFYANDFLLDIRSEPGQGTTVVIHLSAVFEEGQRLGEAR